MWDTDESPTPHLHCPKAGRQSHHAPQLSSLTHPAPPRPAALHCPPAFRPITPRYRLTTLPNSPSYRRTGHPLPDQSPFCSTITSITSPSIISKSAGVWCPLIRVPSNRNRTDDMATPCRWQNASINFSIFVVILHLKKISLPSCAWPQMLLRKRDGEMERKEWKR